MEKGRTVLVTGGCGFIGSNFIHLAAEIRPDWRIINLDLLTYAGNLNNLASFSDNERYRFVKGDIGDAELLGRLFDEEQVDTVVHFAAESHVDRSIAGPAAFINTNILGTFNLLEAARGAWLGETASIKDINEPMFLHVSTDEVFGSLGETGYFTEDTAYDPRSPYSASKASSDHLAAAYFHTYGLPILITNCSNNYGPYQFPEKLIPLVFNNCLEGKPLPIYGDGKNIRDWLHVSDHCRAIIEVLANGRAGRTYNIGGNNEKTNLEVVTSICEILDKKIGRLPDGSNRTSLITFVADRLGHDRRYAIDSSRLKEEIGWQPSLTFEQGIEKTIDWYLANQRWLDTVIDGSYKEYYRNMYQ